MVSNADPGGGDYFKEWEKLAKAEAICAFRIVELEPKTQVGEGNGDCYPVVADVAILRAGDEHQGLVLRKERILNTGLTNKLREKRERVGRAMRTVERRRGEEVALVVHFYKARGRQFVGGRPCTDEEFEIVTKVFEKYAEDPWSGMEREEFAAAGQPLPGVQNADDGASGDELPF